jgi:hypothetical protein
MRSLRWSCLAVVALASLSGCAAGATDDLEQEITVPKRVHPEVPGRFGNATVEVPNDSLPTFPQGYRDYNAFTVSINGSRAVVQTLLESDGTRAWVHACPLRAGVRITQCTAWTSVDLTNVRAVGGEEYSGYGAYVYDKAGTPTLVRTLVDFSGRIGFSRECAIDDGVHTVNCTPWAKTDLASLRGMGDETYRTWGGIVLGAPGAQTLVQTALAIHGRTSFERTCPIDPANGPDMANCSAWTENTLLGLRGGSTEAYAGYGGFVEEREDGGQVLTQSFVSLDGRTSYARSCPIDLGTSTISWSACGAWNTSDLAFAVVR